MTTDETVSSFIRHLRALWRAEALTAEIKLNLLLRRTALLVLAGLLAVLGLVMLNIGGYFALAPEIGDAEAMVLIAVADFVLAGCLVLLANRSSSSLQLDAAQQLRDSAIQALELEADITTRQIRSFIRRPFKIAGSASGILVSILSAWLGARRRR